MFLNIKQASKSCSQLSMYFVPTNIKFENKEIRVFILKDSSSAFALESFPSSDFRLDCSIHTFYKDMLLDSPITIKLTAEKDGVAVTLAETEVKPDAKRKAIQFNHAFKKPDSSYKNLEIEFSTKGNLLGLNFILGSQERQ